MRGSKQGVAIHCTISSIDLDQNVQIRLKNRHRMGIPKRGVSENFTPVSFPRSVNTTLNIEVPNFLPWTPVQWGVHV